MNARGRGGHRRFKQANFRNGGFGNHGNFDAHRMKSESPLSSNGSPPFAPLFQGQHHPQPNHFNSFTGLGSPAMWNTPFYSGGNPYLVNGSSPPYRQPHDASAAHNARPWYPGDPRVDGARFPAPFLASRPLNEVTLNNEFRPAPLSGALVLHGVGDLQRILRSTVNLLMALQSDLHIHIKKLQGFCSADTVSAVWQDALRAEYVAKDRPELTKLGESNKDRGIYLLQSASERVRRRLNEVSCVPSTGADHIAHGSQRSTSEIYGKIWTKGADLVTSILGATKAQHHLKSAIQDGEWLIGFLNDTRTIWVGADQMKADWVKNNSNVPQVPRTKEDTDDHEHESTPESFGDAPHD